MVADAFDDGADAAVADAEAFTGRAVDVSFAAGRAVEGDVADDDVVFRREDRFPRRRYDDLATRQAFAEVIVGIAFQGQCQAMGDEGAETLAGRTDEGQDNRVFSQTFFAVALGDFTAQDGPGDAVRILDAQAGADVFLFFQGRTAHANQFGHIQSRVDFVVLRCREVLADGSVGVRTVQEVLQVDRLGFPVAEVIALFQAIVAADHFVDGMEAQAGHDFPQVLCDEAHEVDDVFRFALEAFAQFFVLCADAVRAGIEVADTQHMAADGQERRRTETKDFSAEKSGDGDVAAGEQFAVDFQGDAVAQAVEEQRLLDFGQADFPGQAGMAQAGTRRSAGPAVIAADDDVVGFCFDDTGCNRADAGAGRQFDADRSLAVGVLEVEDKFGQVFDGVDIVMRRR